MDSVCSYLTGPMTSLGTRWQSVHMAKECWWRAAFSNGRSTCLSRAHECMLGEFARMRRRRESVSQANGRPGGDLRERATIYSARVVCAPHGAGVAAAGDRLGLGAIEGHLRQIRHSEREKALCNGPNGTSPALVWSRLCVTTSCKMHPLQLARPGLRRRYRYL
ncbi:hypothetical protein BC567DRAFT_8252 [Phyllosticta citribraziliensis]